MPRGDKSRGFVAGEAKSVRDLFKELDVPFAQKVQKKPKHHDEASDYVELPPPLFPELNLLPFAFVDPDGSQKWLINKARELTEQAQESPLHLDASAAGPARLLAHLEAIRHLDALPLELMMSRKRAAARFAQGAPTRGGGKGGRIGGAGAAEQFARAAKRAAAAAAGGGGGGGGGGEEGEEGEEGEGREEGEEEEEETEEEEDFTDYMEDYAADDGEDEGGGGADAEEW